MATIEKYQTASGATLYRARYRTPDGRQTDKRGFTTKRDAEAFAVTMEASKLHGGYVAPSLGKTTVGQLGPLWLERQRGHMKPSGFRSYDSAWRTYVEPRWGATPIAAIRFSEVQSWVSELAARRGATTVQRAYLVLRRVLDDAVRDRQLSANPAAKAKLPKQSRRKHTYLTFAQLDRLADESGKYGPLVLLLGAGGLRWGEAAALRPCDIDWLRRRVELHRNAVTVGSQVIIGTLKSHNSRVVVLPAFVIDALARTAEGKGREELLWSTTAGVPLSPPSPSSWLAAAVRRCQADAPDFPTITAHSLRHTAASLAVSAGANVKVVQRMLGHASAAMTLDVYADLFDDDLNAVADRLDTLHKDFTANRWREGKGSL